MLTIRGLETVLCDLAALGFNAKWGVVSAADVGAPHRRDRIWIVATNARYEQSGQPERLVRQERNESVGTFIGNICKDMAYANGSQRRGEQRPGRTQEKNTNTNGTGQCVNNLADTKELFSNGGNIDRPSSQGQIPNTSSIRSQGQREHEQSIGSKESSDWQTNLIKSIGSSDFWEVEPNVGRKVDGLA
jgi:DNA (cytosine-5)-methyltransferase 1